MGASRSIEVAGRGRAGRGRGGTFAAPRLAALWCLALAALALASPGSAAARTAYVANDDSDDVTPIDTATNVAGTAIGVGDAPLGIAITPDGKTAYVANWFSDDVTPIDTATNTAGAAIGVGTSPHGIGITPDGKTAYVANSNGDDVTPIDTATNAAGTAVGAGDGPLGIAIAPDGETAYVANRESDDVTPIDTATNAAGTAIGVGDSPSAIAITPDQPPSAAFSAGPAPAGQASGFDASASSDPDGSIARYDWDFGDGSTLSDGGPTPSHTYAAAGTYTATLSLTDDEGCSSELVFTGQTALCNGSPAALASEQVVVSEPEPTTQPTPPIPDPDAEPPIPDPDPEPPAPDVKVTGLQRDRDEGTAALTVAANVAGNLSVAKTNKVKPFGPVTLDEPGSGELEIIPRNKAAEKLRRTGRITINPLIRLDSPFGETGIRHRFELRRD